MEPETELVPLPGAKPQEDKPAEQPSVAVNVVDLYTDEERSSLAEMCLDDYDEDVDSRSTHMRSLKRWYELYAAVQKVKNWPFQNCANVNIPIETYAVLQVHGRLFDMLVPAKGNIFSSQPTRSSDPMEVDRAERTELFVNWYLKEKVPEYRMSYDATLWQVIIFGSCFRYNYWDVTENKLCTDWIGIDDLVVNYHCTVQDPLMRGRSMRFTRVRWMSLFEVQDRAFSGEYSEKQVSQIDPEEPDEDKSEFRQLVDSVDGKSKPSRDFHEDEDRQVLEQHRWLRMPDAPKKHPAFDGKPHPVIVTVDEMSRKVLRVVLREEDDPRDAKRFAKEKAAFDQAIAANEAFTASGGMTTDPMTGQPMQAPPPPPPPDEPKPTRQREMGLATHYKGFQSEGYYGLGFGHFIGPLNEAMNTLVNQQIDRSTVNNAGGGLISRGMRFQRGPINRQPGEYIEIDAPPAAMRDGLQNWPQVAPDPDGRWFLTYIEQMANRVSGTGDTLSGEPVGSNETARAAMARYEQAQKQISVLAARLVGYMTFDVMTIWRLFSVYLDEEEYHDVVDSMNQPRQVKIGRADFVADARVVPTADPRMASRSQRIEEAESFLGLVTNPQGPPELTQNPAIRRAAIEGVLYARDRHEMIPMLGPPPGPPQPPPPEPQYEENAKFLKDQDKPVHPDDDDDAHLIDMQQFRGDPLGYEKLSPTGRKMFDNHERGHFAQKLVKTRKQDEQRRQQAAQLLGPPGGGPPGMAGPPGNGLPPPGPPS